MAETLLTTLSSGIFTITLNRPEVYNAFNEQLTTDLIDAFISGGHMVLTYGNNSSSALEYDGVWYGQPGKWTVTFTYQT